MASKFSIVSRDPTGVVSLASDGDISGREVGFGPNNPFEVLLGAQWATCRVLLDLDRTGYIDSSAIGWLISCQKDFRRHGGCLVVHSVSPTVSQMLAMLRLPNVVSIADDEAAALALATAP